jgi:hypothetical protein
VIRCITAFFPQPVVLCFAKGFEGSEVGPFDALTIAVHFGFVMSFQDYEGYRIVVGETFCSASLASLLQPLEVRAQNRSLKRGGLGENANSYSLTTSTSISSAAPTGA